MKSWQFMMWMFCYFMPLNCLANINENLTSINYISAKDDSNRTTFQIENSNDFRLLAIHTESSFFTQNFFLFYSTLIIAGVLSIILISLILIFLFCIQFSNCRWFFAQNFCLLVICKNWKCFFLNKFLIVNFEIKV